MSAVVWGLSIHTWGGRPHDSQCRVVIEPDGAASAEIGSQDIGTGTQTVIAMVLAETLGLPVSRVNVKMGDSSLPPSGASGGSTTVGARFLVHAAGSGERSGKTEGEGRRRLGRLIRG